jgi:hypothetical protein
MEAKAGDTQRYRVVLSDVKNFIQTMIAQSALSAVLGSSERANGSQAKMTS